jgi:exonuclease SbcD
VKFLHLGDLHIGKSVNDFSMTDDQKYMLDRILEEIAARGTDAVLIAGDVYDKAVPSEDAVRLFDSFISALADMGTKVFIISGNHDSDERLNFGSSLFEKSNIFITSKFTGSLAKQTFEDEYGNVNIYMLPFVKASQVRHFFPDDDIQSYEDAVRCVISHAEIDQNERNIILSHQFVAGRGRDPELSGSENASVRNVGAVERVSADCYEMFDYAALGHIHSPQAAGRETVRYSGSLLKYSLSEINGTKSMPIVTLGDKGSVDLELVTIKPLRDMRHVKGELKKLLAPENIDSPDDYMYVTLTDEEMIPNAPEIIRHTYPHLMKVDYDNSHTKSAAAVDLSEYMNDRTFEEIISDFYREMYGCEISDEELKIMLEVGEKAGVL